jgi:hypothetical protein
MHVKFADRSKKRGRWLGFAICLLPASLAVAFGLMTRVAYASLDESLLDLGSSALAFRGTPDAAAGDISVNGAQLAYRIETVNAPLARVWQHYADKCSSAAATASLAGSLLQWLATRGAASDTNGYVACVDLVGDDFESFARGAESFGKTWDIHDLGSLRYVYLTSDSVDAQRTLVFAMWSDGPLDMAAFVPTDSRDAPGRDLDEVPRPINARRVLSMSFDGSQMAVYRVPDTSPQSQARWYRSALRSHAWNVIPAGDGGPVSSRGHHLLVGERGVSTASIVLSRTDGGATIVAAFRMEAS